MMTLLQIGILTAILVSVARAFLTRKVITGNHSGCAPSWSAVSACILLAICIRFFLVMLLLRTEFVAFEGDEVNRWALAHQWSQSPFFFSGWDGIWLSGNFAFYGTLMWFFESPLVALQVGNCLAQVVGILGLAHAGYVIGGSRICAIVTALLTAVGYPWVLMGVGALSEALTASLIVPAFTFTLQFFTGPGEQTRNRMICGSSEACACSVWPRIIL